MHSDWGENFSNSSQSYSDWGENVWISPTNFSSDEVLSSLVLCVSENKLNSFLQELQNLALSPELSTIIYTSHLQSINDENIYFFDFTCGEVLKKFRRFNINDFNNFETFTGDNSEKVKPFNILLDWYYDFEDLSLPDEAILKLRYQRTSENHSEVIRISEITEDFSSGNSTYLDFRSLRKDFENGWEFVQIPRLN